MSFLQLISQQPCYSLILKHDLGSIMRFFPRKYSPQLQSNYQERDLQNWCSERSSFESNTVSSLPIGKLFFSQEVRIIQIIELELI